MRDFKKNITIAKTPSNQVNKLEKSSLKPVSGAFLGKTKLHNL